MASQIAAVVTTVLFFCCAVAVPQHADPRNAAIITLDSDISPEGSFTYSYETENGIRAEARGVLNNPGNPELESQSVQGSYSFVADDGQAYTVTYVADENGYQPQGAHLPTPPPIPEPIAHALQRLPNDDPDLDAVVTPAYLRRPGQDGVVNPPYLRRPDQDGVVNPPYLRRPDQDGVVNPAYLRRPDQDGVVNPGYLRRPYGNFYPRP